MTSIETKKALREQFLNKRKKLVPAMVQQQGKKIVETVFSLREFRQAKTIAAFVDYANEPPTRTLIEKALQTGKTVLVPKIGKNNSLSFHSIESLSELKKNERGILEPTGEKNGLEPSEIDLVLVPGIVFDEKGNRLGSGKGFFDRSLSDMKKAFRVGLAFEEFVVAELPTEAHDAKMHALVTEKKTRFFEQKK